MKRFGPGPGSGGFARLLRSAGGRGSIQMPMNNKQKGAMPEKGGSAQRVPKNNAKVQRHMDAKDSMGKQKGGVSRRGGKAWVDRPGVRVAQGDPGFHGREIHHKTQMERAKMSPGKHISVGPIRSGHGKMGTPKKMGSSGMSPEVASRPGVPAHQSVINRGSKHSRSRSYDMAHKIAM